MAFNTTPATSLSTARTATPNNARGYVTEVKHGKTVRASYRYDYRGRRTAKIFAEGQSYGTVLYYYDQWDRLIAESTFYLACEDCPIPVTQDPVKTYVYRGAEPIAQIDHSNFGTTAKVTYLSVDHLATPRVGRDQTGTIVWRWDSDAFGSTAANQDPDGNGQATVVNLRFPGQYFDAETGLHYNHNRYYDPKIGRYYQPDPIGLAGGLNPYAYVGSNPLGFVDPLGLEICAASGQLINCTDGMRPPPEGTPLNGPLSPVGVAATAADAGLAFCPIGRGAANVAKGLAGVPGRVGSRINLSNEGMEHVIARHLSGKANASQFSLSEAELRSVLSSRAAVGSPVVRSVESADGIRYVREFDAGRVIGTDKFNGNQATSVMTIMTDRFGNLVSTFPGLLK